MNLSGRPYAFVLSLVVLAPFLPHSFGTCVSAQEEVLGSEDLSVRSEEMMIGVVDVQAIDAMMLYVPGIGSNGREELARQNVKSYMMPIRQVEKPSQEWAYALTSSLEYYQNLNDNFKENLSPDYLIMSLANQGNRPNVEDGLRFLAAEGTVSANIVPYGSQTIPGAVYSVPKVKIGNFFYLFQESTKGRNRIFEMKKALTRGNPVLVELRTPPDFARFAGARYTASGSGSESHFLNVVGYDGATETVELRGCFGRMWGEAGYVTMSYEDFNALSVRGFVLRP